MKSKEFNSLFEAIIRIEEKLQELKLPQPEIFLNSTEMCLFLKISPSTLRRLRNNGDIPCNQLGRSYFYPKSYFTQELLKSILKIQDDSKNFDS